MFKIGDEVVCIATNYCPYSGVTITKGTEYIVGENSCTCGECIAIVGIRPKFKNPYKYFRKKEEINCQKELAKEFIEVIEKSDVPIKEKELV